MRRGACRRGRVPHRLEITIQPWPAIAAKSVVTGTLVDMDQTFLTLIIGILLALALGFLLGWVLRGRSSPAGSGDESLVLRTQLEMVQGQLESMKADQDTENKILLALNPVATKLNDMQKTVADLEKQRSDQHGQISEQLRSALQSDELLRSTTEGLASALRSNSMRGKWGEVQLRRVVEAAGLIERVDFDLQSSISSDAGLGKPDMVVHLPGGKNIAVDAKVPFTAYMEASSIPMTATGEEGARRERLLKDHVAAVRAHIDALGKKSYWDGLEASPELVICFIPSEALVSSALEADPGLMDHAFSKKVALASPVTLWSVLKTVAFSWRQDVVTEDALRRFFVVIFVGDANVILEVVQILNSLSLVRQEVVLTLGILIVLKHELDLSARHFRASPVSCFAHESHLHFLIFGHVLGAFAKSLINKRALAATHLILLD